MNQIKKDVLAKVMEHAARVQITDANRKLPGEKFDAYMKRMTAQRKVKAE